MNPQSAAAVAPLLSDREFETPVDIQRR